MAAAGASVAVALGSSRTPVGPPAPPSTSHPQLALAKPAKCATWGCTKAQTVDLGNGYAISLWRTGKPGDFTTEPVIELTRGGVSVQWSLWPRGYGWAASLQCNAGAAEPNCMLTDGAGVHSAAAQMVILRAGKLVLPAKAYVVADLPTIAVTDLDDNGYLDIVALDSDYTPNFAQGHLFWRTFRYADDELVSTGCTPRRSSSEAAPTVLLTGACPRL